MSWKEVKFKRVKWYCLMVSFWLCICILLRADVLTTQAETGSKFEVTRISCVGDSLTYGYTSSNQATQSYPAQLQKLLGNGYQVSNFGVNSSTMLKNGNKPYWKQSAYTESLNSKPDIVILMLGTNDSKAENWSSHKEEFASDMKEMIQSYRNLSTRPEVYVGLSPRLTVDEVMGLVNETIIKEIVPIQRQVAEEMECPVLDIFGLSQTMTEDFNDSVHPTDIGYQKIACYIYGELTGKNVEMRVLNDTDPQEAGWGFQFTGKLWTQGNTVGSINGGAGDEHYAVVTENDAAEHFYEIFFTGNRIQVYGHLSPLHGIVKYSIDGGEETEVSSYGSGRSGNALLYQAAGLSDGPHVLKAAATGRKEAPAQNAVIQVDYAKVFTEHEKATCTCRIKNVSFSGQSAEIPENEQEKRIALQAQAEKDACKMEGHGERKLTYEFYEEEDSEDIGVLEGSVLTVTKPGTITIGVIVSIEGKDIQSTETAVFTVTKAVIQETEPPKGNTDKPGIGDNKPVVSTAGAVKNLRRVSNKEKSITLSWDKGKDADGYFVYRYQSSNKKWIRIKDISGPSWKDSKCKAGTVYRYRVSAYRKMEEGILEGDPAYLTTATLPSRPKLSVQKKGTGSVRLIWKKGTRADGFIVEMKIGKKKYSEIEKTGGKKISYRKKGLKKGVTYHFRMKGFKKAGGKKIYSKYSVSRKITLL